MLPGWVWLIMGAAIAVFVIAIVHLARPRHDVRSVLAPSTAPPSAMADAPVAVPPKQPSQYSFYETLPRRNLAAPPPTPPAKAPTPAPAPTPAQPPAAPSVAAKAAPAAATDWAAQLGAYRDRAEADSLRARAALLGIVSRTEVASVDGQTWYRVRSTPAMSRPQAEKLVERLHANGITALLVRNQG
ncbi:MAG TPA: SPOR domain-containing protein [Nevskiaceae bacterium]